MAVTFVAYGSTSYPYYNGVPNKPNGVAVGDILVLTITSPDSATHALTANASGWTKFYESNPSATLKRSQWWYRVASTSYTAPTIGSTGMNAGATAYITAWRGAATVGNPIHVVGTGNFVGTGAINNITAPSITISASPCMIVASWARAGTYIGQNGVSGAASTLPANDYFGNSNGLGSSGCFTYGVKNASGATGTTTINFAASMPANTPLEAVQFAIKDANATGDAGSSLADGGDTIDTVESGTGVYDQTQVVLSPPTFVAAGNAGYPGFGSTPTLPTGIAQGDLAFLVVASRDPSNAAHSLSANGAGWTKFIDEHVLDSANLDVHLSVWWKYNDGSLVAPTVAATGDNSAYASIFAMRGAFAPHPIDAVSTAQIVQSTSGAIVVPNVTTTTKQTTLIAIGLSGIFAYYAAATGAAATECLQGSNSNGNGVSFHVVRGTVPSAGATGTTTITRQDTTTATATIGIQFALASTGTTSIPSMRRLQLGASIVGTGTPTALKDGRYRNSWAWSCSSGSWAAIDLGVNPSRTQIAICLSHEDAGGDINSGGLANFTIKTSADSTNGTDGTWTSYAVTNHPYIYWMNKAIPFTGCRWVRLEIGTGVSAVDEFEIWDSTNGNADTYLFVGDSITVRTGHRGDLAGAGVRPSFQDEILLSQGQYPLQISCGIVGIGADTVDTNINTWLAAFPCKHVLISIGTNDARGLAAGKAAFKSKLVSIVQKVKAAGSIPQIARIPYTSDVGYGGGAYGSDGTYIYNTAIDEVTAEQGLTPGPDLYSAFYTNAATWYTGDAVHPNEDGVRAWNLLWSKAVAPFYSAQVIPGGSGADTIDATDAGTGTAQAPVAGAGSGGDSVSPADVGAGAAISAGSGSDSVSPSDTGSAAGVSAGSGSDSVSPTDGGTGASRSSGAGGDSVSPTDSGTGSSLASGTGGDSVSASDGGTGAGRSAASGGDSVSTSDAGTGSAINPQGGSGGDSIGTNDSGTGVAKSQGSGSDSVTPGDTGSGAAPAIGSGGDTVTPSDSGVSGALSNASGGDSSPTTTDSGTASSKAVGGGSDSVDASDAGTVTAPAFGSGGDSVSPTDSGVSGTFASGSGGDTAPQPSNSGSVVNIVIGDGSDSVSPGDAGAGVAPSAGSGGDTVVAFDVGSGGTVSYASGDTYAPSPTDGGTVIDPTLYQASCSGGDSVEPSDSGRVRRRRGSGAVFISVRATTVNITVNTRGVRLVSE